MKSVRHGACTDGTQWLTPDLNQIEQVFAKLKHMLRDACERTIDTTWRRIGARLNCFTPTEYASYLINAG